MEKVRTRNYIGLLCVVISSWSNLVECGPGTTLNIEEIFTGRCYQYQEVASNRLLKPDKHDCLELWGTFRSAFAFKDPADLKRSDYQPFFSMAKQSHIPVNKTVLWSGTYDIAHRYAADGSRYVTMEDSLIGYLSNGLHWCGSKLNGINFTACPDWQDLPKEASQSFWGGASSTFASGSTGEIKLVLKGSNPNRPAYDRSSFFANYELPSIQVVKASVRIILVNELGKPALEHCNNGSLILLEEDMIDRGLDFVCEENPPDILHLMCMDQPDANECKFLRRRSSASLATLLNPKSRSILG